MFYCKSPHVLFATLFCLLGLFPNHVLAHAMEDSVESHIKKMSLEQKVGQLFMVGLPQSVVDGRLRQFILKVKPGSFLLFKRNIKSFEQVKSLNKTLAALALESSGIGPLIAVDQESGVVSRVPISPPLPNALALGQTDSPILAQSYGEGVGSLLKQLGFNMNLAPVLDLSDPQQPSFIGVRSLGADPEKVGHLGHSLSKGLISANVIPTAKHFPGLGSSTHDSHHSLVTRITSLEDFYATDLKPFEKFSSLGPQTAIMLSHFSYPVLDSSNVPAVFSEKIIRSLLRKKLNFSGLIITDDLMMQGASEFAKPEEAALLALKAGADIIMVTWSFRAQEKAIARIKSAVIKKELLISDVDEKVRRILHAKLLTQGQKNLQSSRVAASKNSLKQVEQDILESNIRSQAHKFTAVTGENNFCVVATHRAFLSSYRKGSMTKAKYLTIPLASTGSDLEKVIAKSTCRQVLFPIYGKKTFAIINDLSPEIKANFMLVNLSAPMASLDESSYLGVVNLYFAHFNAGEKIAQHLSLKKKSTADYQVRATSR